MNAEFWIKAWQEGRTGFHKQDYHEKLVEFFPRFNAKEGESVLVPLCGKTKDMIWLQDQKLNVHGVELHEEAVKGFFTDNHLSPVEHKETSNFIEYRHKNILISCGDFFKLNSPQFDYVYDRAALVALPFEMRKKYAEVIKRSLKVGGKYLLIVYEYDQTRLDGPPFSVNENEVRDHYQDHFEIKLVASEKEQNEGPRLAAAGGIEQKVYLLEKIR